MACKECKILLDKAADAIAAHANAVAGLTEVVKSNPEAGLKALEADVQAARLTREISVAEYESHLACHEFKLMATASGATGGSDDSD
ncbi:MAG: hypothetical protein JWO80_3176 [Bryobacterales bacterium]|nr:hypothetical protein [Bryobacterales bacterium]